MQIAWLAHIRWNVDCSVSFNVPIFTWDHETEDYALRAAQSLYPDHTVYYVERAPWLDQPKEGGR